MLTKKKSVLNDSVKINILRHIINGDSPSQLLDSLKPEEIIEAQRFVWEKTIEFGIKIKGKEFSEDDLRKKFTPIPVYQKQMKCEYPESKCRGIDCFYTHPDCAINKAKERVDVMAREIEEILGVHRD